MDDFHDRRQLYGAHALVSQQFGGQQQQSGPDALASAGAEVLTDLRDRGDV